MSAENAACRYQTNAASEAWRYTGPFTRWNRFKGAFPGFGIGLGAFILYSAYEAAFTKDTHGHGEGLAAH